MSAASKPEWAEAVIRVGDGRGFIVAAGDERLIITAGHCLPGLPPYHGASCLYERTFDALLARSGRNRKSALSAYSPIRSLILPFSACPTVRT
jgi:hypothetical protein